MTNRHTIILRNSLYKITFCFFLLYQLLDGFVIQAQTISPAGTANFCAGGSVTLTVSGAPASSSYQWKLGTGNVGINQATFSALTAGSYTVVITGSAAGLPDTLGPVVVTVISNPTVTVSLTNICAGTSGNTLTASGADSYTWSPTAGLSPTSGATITAAPTAAGSYIVTGRITATGCTNTATVTVNPKPDAAFTFSGNNQCANKPFNFLITNPAPGVTYTWDFGDGTSGSGSNINHAFSNANSIGNNTFNYSVKVVAKSTFGCTTQSAAQTVTVKQKPSVKLGGDPPVTDYNGKPYFVKCETTSSAILTFYNESTTTATNTSYIIRWGDGTPNYSNNSSWAAGFAGQITHTYQVGLFQLTLIVASAACIDSTKYYVFVGSNPKGSISSPGSTTGCTGNPFSFPFANIQDNPPGTEYIIFVNDGISDTVRYTQENVPAEFTHIFNKNSCGVAANNTFTVSFLFSNPCGETPGTIGGIRISEKAKADFSISPKDTICQNTVITFTNKGDTGYTVPNTGNGACTAGKTLWQISPATGWNISGAGSLGSDNANPTNADSWISGSSPLRISFNTPGVYTIKLKTGTSRCGQDSITKTICVNSIPTANFNIDQIIGCAPLNVNTTNITNTNTCGNNTYAWTISYQSTTGCLPNSFNFIYTGGTNASSINPKFQFINPGIYTISLIATSPAGACTSIAFSKTVEVKGKPVVSVNAIPDICQESSINPSSIVSCFLTAATYAWSFPSGSPISSAVQTPDLIKYSSAGNFIITLSVTNECGTSTDSKPLVVNPTPKITPKPDTTFCAGQSVLATVFTSSINGTVYSWTNSNTGIGLSSTSSTGNLPAFTATNATNLPITSTIIVTPTFNGCVGVKATFTITVNPLPAVIAPVNQTVCKGAPTAAINFTGSNVASTVYDWTNSNTSIGLGASGTGNIASFIGLNTTNAPITATITVTPNFTNAGKTCPGTARTFTITINPTPTVTNPADQTLCNGSSTAAINFTGSGVAGTTYSWINNNTAIGLAASGSTNIGSFTATNSGSSPITATITVTPGYTFNNVACSGLSETFTITVNPAPLVSFSAVNQAICSGGSSAAILLSSVTPNVNISWSSTPPAGITGVTPTSGTTSIPTFTLTISTTSFITVNFVAVAATAGATACPGASSTYSIVVNPIPVVTQPGNTVVCNGSSTAAINFASNVSGSTYTWTSDNTSIGLEASGNGNINTFSATNSGNTPVVATITVTPRFVNGSATCTGLPKTFTITVNPTPTVLQPASQVVCNGAATTLISFGGSGVSGTTYSWTNTTTSIGLEASGTGDIASFTAVNTTTSPVVATIVVTPTYTNGGTTCTGATKTFTITVNPTPTVTQPGNVVFCNNSTTTAISFSGTVASTSYSWVNDKPGIGLAANGTGNIAAFTAVNTGTAPVIATITVTPNFTNGSVTCSGTARTFTITIHPTPTVSQPANQTVCTSSSTTLLTLEGSSVTSTTYSWVNNTTSIGLGASGNGNINAFIATNTGSSLVTATIVVTPNYANTGTSCNGPTKSFTIVVNPAPTVTQPTNQVICNGSNSTAITISGSAVSGTVYNWTNDNTAIGLAASGTGNIAAFTGVNDGNTAITSNITIM